MQVFESVKEIAMPVLGASLAGLALAACSGTEPSPRPLPSTAIHAAPLPGCHSPLDRITVTTPRVEGVIEIVVEHDVQPGDTVSGLADCFFANHALGVIGIQAANPNKNSTQLVVNDKLDIYITDPAHVKVPKNNIESDMLGQGFSKDSSTNLLAHAQDAVGSNTEAYIPLAYQDACTSGLFYYVVQQSDVNAFGTKAIDKIQKRLGNPSEFADSNLAVNKSHLHPGQVLTTSQTAVVAHATNGIQIAGLYQCP